MPVNVNGIEELGAVTGARPTIQAVGTDTNVGLQILPQAAGVNTLDAGVINHPASAPVYGVTVTPDSTLGMYQPVTVTNTTAFTIAAPANTPATSRTRELLIEIFNNSGGVMGAVTWNAAYVLTGGAFTNPASGKARFIRFLYSQTRALWVEVSRAAADY